MVIFSEARQGSLLCSTVLPETIQVIYAFKIWLDEIGVDVLASVIDGKEDLIVYL